MKLDRETCDRIIRLNGGGMTAIQIADFINVPHRSVVNILTGRRRPPPTRAKRCPGCGGLVYMPCRKCAMNTSVPKTQGGVYAQT